MAGLLDFGIEDPDQKQAANMGLLSLGLRLMSTPGKFGQALGQAGLGSMGDYQQALQAAQAQKMQKLQVQQHQMALQQAQQQQADKEMERNWRQNLPSPQMQANQQALAVGGGPSRANAAQIPTVDPVQQMMFEGVKAGALPFDQYLQTLTPKPADYKVVGDSLVQIGKGGVTEAYRAPAKAEKDPSSIQEYKFAVAQGYKGSFEDWDRSSKRAGATNLNVNTGERIPHQLVKQQDDLIDKMTIAKSIEADIGQVSSLIDSGKLDFGPVRNFVNQGRNIAGVSSEESRNFATFRSTLEKMRNDSLRLNTGVQTEGDAQRAWNELFQGINDKELVSSRLKDIARINKRAANLHEYRLSVLRANSGAGPLPSVNVPPAINAPKAEASIDDLLKIYGN